MSKACAIAVALVGLLATTDIAVASTELLKIFESRYNSVASLQASFLERYYENGKLVRAEAGQAYFQRPGKMRWDYESPEKNTFLVDGKYVWFYSPADHTATRMPTKQSEDWRTPLAFLTSNVKLSRICRQVSSDTQTVPSKPADQIFMCELRRTSEGDGGKVTRFEISPGGELVRILVPQEGGIMLEFSFGGWRYDPELPKALFQFTPPGNTVVVDGLLPESPGLRQ